MGALLMATVVSRNRTLTRKEPGYTVLCNGCTVTAVLMTMVILGNLYAEVRRMVETLIHDGVLKAWLVRLMSRNPLL